MIGLACSLGGGLFTRVPEMVAAMKKGQSFEDCQNEFKVVIETFFNNTIAQILVKNVNIIVPQTYQLIKSHMFTVAERS